MLFLRPGVDMLQDGEQMLIAAGNAVQASSSMDVCQLYIVCGGPGLSWGKAEGEGGGDHMV